MARKCGGRGRDEEGEQEKRSRRTTAV